MKNFKMISNLFVVAILGLTVTAGTAMAGNTGDNKKDLNKEVSVSADVELNEKEKKEIVEKAPILKKKMQEKFDQLKKEYDGLPEGNPKKNEIKKEMDQLSVSILFLDKIIESKDPNIKFESKSKSSDKLGSDKLGSDKLDSDKLFKDKDMKNSPMLSKDGGKLGMPLYDDKSGLTPSSVVKGAGFNVGSNGLIASISVFAAIPFTSLFWLRKRGK